MITFGEFASAVQNHMPRLQQAGYQLEGMERPFVTLVKRLPPETICTIRFDLLDEIPLPVTPYRQFDVELFRASPSHGAQSYKPLAIDLRNLLWGYYRLDTLAYEFDHTGKWTFTNREQLIKHLETAHSLLIEYAVPWLHDPSSDIEWVKHPRQ